MLAKTIIKVANISTGYIAGTGNGIVTVAGKPTSRHIYLLDAQSLIYLRHTVSLPNGHYLINNLDPTKQYLIICRDYNKEYEPAVWDYVTPATDKTLAEQQALWDSWQDA